MNFIPPKEYFDKHYLSDFRVFGSSIMCAWEIGPLRTRSYQGLSEFILCQFGLNLLNQAIYTHAHLFFPEWERLSAPFADVRACSHHGYGQPFWFLKCMQEPITGDISRSVAFLTPPVSLDWKIVSSFTNFFLHDYLSQIVSEGSNDMFPLEDFWEGVAGDPDCKAMVYVQGGLESKHVAEDLSGSGRFSLAP
jgi:hypothetical protein